MAVVTSQPHSISPDEKLQPANMATTTSPKTASEERNGLEVNGSHVAPIDVHPDAAIETNLNGEDSAPAAKEQATKTESPGINQQQNGDALALDHHPLPAKPPPTEDAMETVQETAAEATTKSADSKEVKVDNITPEVVGESKDTEMVDAPAAAVQEPTPASEAVVNSPKDALVEKPAEVVEPSNVVADVPTATALLTETDLPIETPQPEESKVSESNADVDMDTSSAPTVDPASSVDNVAETQVTAFSDVPTISAVDDVNLQPASLSNLAIGESQEYASAPITADTSMTDVPSQTSAVKVAREREDDEADEPLAKRTKTSGEEGVDDVLASKPEPDAMAVDPPTGMPVSLSVNGRPRNLNDPALVNNPITPQQAREIRKVLDGQKKTKNGGNFKGPVQTLWPQLWETYRNVVQNPTDLTTIGTKLREQKYANFGAFWRDIDLLQENSIAFNGADHIVTKSAQAVIEQVHSKLRDIPAETPSRLEKQEPKQIPTRHVEQRAPPPAPAPVRTQAPAAAPPPQRKESRPPATTPTEKVSDSSVFAVPASGMPLIRRDSTKNNDGDRPKRPIHPPKSKDLGFQTKNLKKKKLQPAFKFCEEVLNEVKKGRYHTFNQYFLEPVDPVALNIPMYHKMIKRPMDLGTMTNKLHDGEYDSPKAFEADFSLMIKNCNSFNPTGHAVRMAGEELEKVFKAKWQEKDSWMAKHAPPVPASAARSGSPRGGKDDSDDEGDASDQDPDEDGQEALLQSSLNKSIRRFEEEQKRLHDMIMAPTPDTTDINMQRQVVTIFQDQIVEQKSNLAALQSKKPSAKPKTSKKKTNSSAGGGGAAAAAAGRKASSSTAGAPKKASGGGSKKATPRTRKLNGSEKEIVSDGIGRLDGRDLERAIDIIKTDTSITESGDSELELDMDQLSDGALIRLYDIVTRAFPELKAQHKKAEPEVAPVRHASGSSKAAKPKKNKPMGKAEQERKLEQLRELKSQFNRGSGSQEPLPSVETSGDQVGGDQPPPGPHDDSEDASSSEEE